MPPDPRPLSGGDRAAIHALSADVARVGRQNADLLHVVGALHQQLVSQAQDRRAEQDLKSAVFTAGKLVHEAAQVATSEPGRALYIVRSVRSLLEDPDTERQLVALQDKAFLEQASRIRRDVERDLTMRLGADAVDRIERLIAVGGWVGAVREFDAVQRAAARIGVLSSSSERAGSYRSAAAALGAGFVAVALLATSDSTNLFGMGLAAWIGLVAALVIRARRSRATRVAVLQDLANVGLTLAPTPATDTWLLEEAQQRRAELVAAGFPDRQIGLERQSLLESLESEQSQLMRWMKALR